SRGEHFCAPARFPERESFFYGFFDVFATPRCNSLANKYFLIGCQIYLHTRHDTSNNSQASRYFKALDSLARVLLPTTPLAYRHRCWPIPKSELSTLHQI